MNHDQSIYGLEVCLDTKVKLARLFPARLFQ